MLNIRLLMTMNINKIPLDLNFYAEYGIDQQYSAYIITIDSLGENESENLEWEYTSKGYKVFHSELKRVKDGKFQMKLIIAKLEYSF